jgi:hypothetical protein
VYPTEDEQRRLDCLFILDMVLETDPGDVRRRSPCLTSCPRMRIINTQPTQAARHPHPMPQLVSLRLNPLAGSL